MKSTTIIAVRRGGRVAMAGDGQVTLGSTVMKNGARKIRLIHGDGVMVGFAGGAADGLALMEKLEQKLDAYGGNLRRAAVELAKDWRMDKALRRLEAVMLVSDGDALLLLSGSGDVIEPDDDVLAIGSGGPYALAAARALMKHTDMTALEIATEAIGTAAGICIYTNDSIITQELPAS